MRQLASKRILSYIKSEHCVFVVDDDPSAKFNKLMKLALYNIENDKEFWINVFSFLQRRPSLKELYWRKK